MTHTPKRMDGYVRVSRVGGREGPGYMSPDVQREAIERWADLQGRHDRRVARGRGLLRRVARPPRPGGRRSALARGQDGRDRVLEDRPLLALHRGRTTRPASA